MAMALSVLIMSCGAGRSKAGGNNNDTMTEISGQEVAFRSSLRIRRFFI